MAALLVVYAVVAKWLDSATTYAVLSRRGHKREANIIMRKVMQWLGTSQAIALAMGVWCTPMYFLAQSLLDGTSLMFVWLNGILTIVVINNFWQMKKLNIPWRAIFKD